MLTMQVLLSRSSTRLACVSRRRRIAPYYNEAIEPTKEC